MMIQARKTTITLSRRISKFFLCTVLFFTFTILSSVSNAQVLNSDITDAENKICFEKSPFYSAKYITDGVGLTFRAYLVFKNIVFIEDKLEDGEDVVITIDGDAIKVHTDKSLGIGTAVISACGTKTNISKISLSTVQIFVSSDLYKKRWEKSLRESRAWLERYRKEIKLPKRVNAPQQLR